MRLKRRPRPSRPRPRARSRRSPSHGRRPRAPALGRQRRGPARDRAAGGLISTAQLTSNWRRARDSQPWSPKQPGTRFRLPTAADIKTVMAQLRMMARFDGRQPCSYRLDQAVNWLPEALSVGLPHGADGLCFAHADGEVVVLPDGVGFALA